MKKSEIMNKVGLAFHKAGFQLKKHSPEIFIVAGVVGVVASAVMACKATTKVGDVLEDTKESVDIIHEGMETGEIAGQECSEKDCKKALIAVYAQTGLKLTKLYAPSVILGTLSITSILTSHNILRKRNMALAAAYATVDKSFKEYRNRVVDRFGEEVEREIRYNIKEKEIEEKVVDKNGKEKTVTKKVKVAENFEDCSEYAKIFDACNSALWQNDPQANRFFIDGIQNYANNLLVSRGYLFLNEVYKALGFEPTVAGQVVGWIYNSEDPKADNYVDFGLSEILRPDVRDFINGYEACVILDFNVQGNILDKVPIERV